MRKYIFPHPILLIGGRFLCILYLCFSSIWGYQVFFNFNEIGIWGTVPFIVLTSCGIYIAPFFWPAIWGSLTITSEAIKFHGLFLPTVLLPFEEIKYVAIRTFQEGNVVYEANANVDAFKFLLLSAAPLPTTAIQKIKSSRKNKLIKFAVSQKLCEILVDKLNDQHKGYIKYQLYLYKKANRK